MTPMVQAEGVTPHCGSDFSLTLSHLPSADYRLSMSD